MPKKQVRPPREVITQVIENGIIPLLLQMETGLGCYLTTIVTVDVNGLLGPRIGIVPERAITPDKMNLRGEVRLRFRETFKEGRYLYKAEGIYAKGHEDGYSGFDAGGEVMVKEVSISLTPHEWTVRYNVWDWQGWF